MGKRNELEPELSEARKERDRNYELRDIILREGEVLGADMDERIRRMEQYLLSESMAEKDKIEYANKRLDVLKRRWDFEEMMEDFKRRMDRKCEETEYKICELEDRLSEMSEEGEK